MNVDTKKGVRINKKTYIKKHMHVCKTIKKHKFNQLLLLLLLHFIPNRNSKKLISLFFIKFFKIDTSKIKCILAENT